MWIGTFSDSEDRCYSATGNFYYANDRIRFVMPIHVLPYLEEDGPNKMTAAAALKASRKATEDLLRHSCIHIVSMLSPSRNW